MGFCVAYVLNLYTWLLAPITKLNGFKPSSVDFRKNLSIIKSTDTPQGCQAKSQRRLTQSGERCYLIFWGEGDIPWFQGFFNDQKDSDPPRAKSLSYVGKFLEPLFTERFWVCTGPLFCATMPLYLRIRRFVSQKQALFHTNRVL